jgi:putative membrane protein
LIINALMIWFCTKIVDGFIIHNFLTALLFSLILSVSQSILFSLSDDK